MSSHAVLRASIRVLAPIATAVVLLVTASTAGATTFLVNDSGEASDLNFGGVFDGICDVDAGTMGAQCTLEAAIQEINAETIADPVIHFSVDVTLAQSPPALTRPATIDGCNGTPAASPCVTIDQTGAGAGVVLSGPDQTVRGIAFKGSDSSSSGVFVTASSTGATIAGNWFGLDDAGVAGSPATGVNVDSQGNGTNIIIGGTTPADRNVFVNGLTGIALNQTNEVTIVGNYFSVEADGSAPTTPLVTAIEVGTDSRFVDIGSALSVAEQATPACDGPCNLIGASTTGIDLTPTVGLKPWFVEIHGNYIGATADGSAALPAAATGVTGIDVGEARDVNIGDGTASRRNVIGGDWTNGIVESGTLANLAVRGNHLGVNAAGTATIPMGGSAVIVSSSSDHPTYVVGNRISNNAAAGVAVAVGGEYAYLHGNVFGVGTGGESLPMAQAVRLTGSNAEVGGAGVLANVFCGSTLAAAIEINAGVGNFIGRNFIGTDAAGATCPGGMSARNHSGVRIHNNATSNVIGTFEDQSLTIADTEHDAIVVNGTGSTGNDFRYFSASSIGEQVIDLGAGVVGDAPGNTGNVGNADADAPIITAASTGTVGGAGAVAGATIRVYTTTSANGAQPTQASGYIASDVDADGGTWNVSLALGNAAVGNRLTVLQVLSDGTTTELSTAFAMIDGSPPNTSITDGPTGVTADSTPTFTFAADEATLRYTCRIGDSGAFADCANPYTTAPLADGTYTIHARAVDLGSYVDSSPATRSFTIDTTAPDTSVGATPTGTIRTTSTSVTFDAGAETGATFQCSLDGAAYAACTSPLALTGLAQGAHAVDVRALDALGNTDATPARATFSVDSIAPTATFTPAIWIVDSLGRTKPKLRCVDASLPCTGSITVTSAAKLLLPSGKRSVVTFASARYTRRATTASPLTLTLSKANRALLASLGSVRVKVKLVARDPHGNARTTNRVITLRVAPPTR